METVCPGAGTRAIKRATDRSVLAAFNAAFIRIASTTAEMVNITPVSRLVTEALQRTRLGTERHTSHPWPFMQP